MRKIMRWKFLFDVLTLLLIGLIIGSYWFPWIRVSQQLVDYWFSTLVIFVGAREVGRWIGDHQQGKYIMRFIAHGEIYLLLFLTLPFIMGVPEAFFTTGPTDQQKAVMAMATELGLKVSFLYATSAVSKGGSEKYKDFVDKLSTFINAVLTSSKKSPSSKP
jgi:hypothetical protein